MSSYYEYQSWQIQINSTGLHVSFIMVCLKIKTNICTCPQHIWQFESYIFYIFVFFTITNNNPLPFLFFIKKNLPLGHLLSRGVGSLIFGPCIRTVPKTLTVLLKKGQTHPTFLGLVHRHSPQFIFLTFYKIYV